VEGTLPKEEKFLFFLIDKKLRERVFLKFLDP